MNILHEIIASLEPHLKQAVRLSSETELLGPGLIDSIAMIQITLDLERRLRIRLGAADLEFDHFATVGTLADRLTELGAKA